jgi:hypothetical protein
LLLKETTQKSWDSGCRTRMLTRDEAEIILMQIKIDRIRRSAKVLRRASWRCIHRPPDRQGPQLNDAQAS